jgi:NADPH:quinone reductase-like Zn-dependent oxidoreductase
MAVSQLFIGPTADAPQAQKPASIHRLGPLPAAPMPQTGPLALPQIMTAARINQLGPPQIIALERVDVPEPQELQVLVRVCAAGVGPWDALVRTGKSGLPLTPPLTLGAEISGIVEKVGANTTGFAPGDEVFGATNPLFIMGYAEYAVVSARMIAKKSAALSHIEAAAMPVVGVMAWQMLFDHAALREGQTVVIHGGTGNVGAYAVQLARAKKLRVVATVRNGDADYVRGLGAHEVVNTETDNLTNFARRADAVIDTVGGPGAGTIAQLRQTGRHHRLFGVAAECAVGAKTAGARRLFHRRRQYRATGAARRHARQERAGRSRRQRAAAQRGARRPRNARRHARA